MNIKLISTIIVLLIIVGSFSTVGSKTQENNCNCNNLSNTLSSSFGDNNPTKLGLLNDTNFNPNDFLGRDFKGEISYDIFDWRDASLDDKGHGVPGGYDWTTGVRDQGACGSCYAFGSLASLEGIIKLDFRNPNKVVDLSEQHIVSCGNSGIYGCCGAYFSSSLSFIQSKGVFSEDCFSYQDGGFFYNHDNCNDQDSDVSCLDSNCTGRIKEYDVEDWFTVDATREQIQLALIQHGPLVTAMYVPGGENYSGFRNYPNGDNTDENHIYRHASSEYTNHMICIVGFDDNLGCWICKNSWGKGWGITKDGEPNNGDDGGWFRIGYGSCNIEQKTAYFVLKGIKLSTDIPKAGIVGEKLSFFAEATNGDEPYTYKWDFDDDDEFDKEGNSAEYTYDNPGVYYVTITVEDNRTNGARIETITEEIRIYENPPTIDVTITNITKIDEIEGAVDIPPGPEWYYKIYVKDNSDDEWKYNIKSDSINEKNSLIVTSKKVDVKIVLLENDTLSKDDIADISAVPDQNYTEGKYDDIEDSNITDLEEYTAYIVTYDITSGKKSYTANGTDDGSSGTEGIKDENDAKLEFEIDSDYVRVGSVDIVSPNQEEGYVIHDGDIVLDFEGDQPISFEASDCSGGCPEVYSYEWDFDYWGTHDVFNVGGKGKSIDYSFGTPKKCKIGLRVNDGITTTPTNSIDILGLRLSYRPQVWAKHVRGTKISVKAEDDDNWVKYGFRQGNSNGEYKWTDEQFDGTHGYKEYTDFDLTDYGCPSGRNSWDTVDVIAEDKYGLRSDPQENVNPVSKNKFFEKPYFSPWSFLLKYLTNFDFEDMSLLLPLFSNFFK